MHTHEDGHEERGTRGSSAIEYMLIAVALLVGIVVALYQIGSTTEEEVQLVEDMLRPEDGKP